MNLAKRVQVLERIAATAAIYNNVGHLDDDPRECLIKRVSQLAERAESWGEMPPSSDGEYGNDPKQVTEILQEYLRSKYGELD
jgi:hypothetical protein